MRIFFLVDGSFLFFCSALSILNYNVNIDVQLHLINSTETDFKAFSLLECAMYASFNVYLSARYDSKTKTCVLSNSHFLTTVPSTGSYVLQLLGKGMYNFFVVFQGICVNYKSHFKARSYIMNYLLENMFISYVLLYIQFMTHAAITIIYLPW